MTRKTHDYTKRHWGHDYAIIEVEQKPYVGAVIHAIGWGHGLMTGNFILFENKESSNGATRYKIESIEYKTDPRDMWSGVFKHAPRNQK